MKSASEALWKILHARDRAAIVCTQTYANWIKKQQEEIRAIKEYLSSVDADRQVQLENLRAMQTQLDEQGVARHHAESKVRELEQALEGTRTFLAAVQADAAERLRAIEEMQRQLAEAGAARHAAEAKLAEVVPALAGTRAYLEQAEADRAARLAALETMQKQLETHGLARHVAETRVAELEQILAARSDEIASLRRECAPSAKPEGSEGGPSVPLK